METPKQLLFLLSLWISADTLKLPHYIKPCSRNDPDLNACGKEHAIQAIPQFINGDPKYRVPLLEPILIEELSVNQGSSNFGLSLVIRNSTLAGLKDVQVRDTRFDLDRQHTEYQLFFPALTIHCHYNVSGKVLILPITGNGDGVLVLKGVDVNITHDFEKVRRTANEKEYLMPKNSTLNFDIQDMTIHLENLFNGDKFLGDNMNIFLNENWRELLKELRPALGEAASKVVSTILTNIFELVPYDETFPEKV